MTTNIDNKKSIKEILNKYYDIIENKIKNLRSEETEDILILTQNELIPYIITDELILKMIEKIEESIYKGVELGFYLYKDIKTNILTSMSECIGTKNCIKDVEAGVEFIDNKIRVGFFHTRIKSLPYASIVDLHGTYLSGLSIIGGLNMISDISIKCYERKSEYEYSIQREIFNETIKERQFIKGDIRLLMYPYSKKLREITNNYFNVIDII